MLQRVHVSEVTVNIYVTHRVRKKYGKDLANKRIDRNYEYFKNIRLDLLTSAQLLIAYIWRMNRIKIKLARKKREKEEAAKKKAMNTKGKYSYGSTSKLFFIIMYHSEQGEGHVQYSQ